MHVPRSTPAKVGLRRPLVLRNLRIPHRVLLAPLAGVTDVPFRRICQEQGAGLTYVEMLSATAVVYRARRTMGMMARHESEAMLGVQFTGADAGEVVGAMAVLRDRPFDVYDLNMGCPVRKIVAKGWGAALLKAPDRLEVMVRAVRAQTDRPVTAKVRLGFTRAARNVEATVCALAAGGVDLITIHGRSREDRYDTPADVDAIRCGVDAVRAVAGDAVRVIGNGDVFGRSSAERMIQETGCDGVMVSRGALGNPWVFRDILGHGPALPTVLEWEDVVLRHLAYHQAHYPDPRLAAILFRKHLLWYLTGFPGVKRMRVRASIVPSLDAARDLVQSFVAGLPGDLIRAPGGTHDDPERPMDRSADRGVGDQAVE